MTTDKAREIAAGLSEAQKRAHELARPLFNANAVIPARRFVNEAGRMIYSKVAEGTMRDLTDDEADCFLVHAFAVVEAAAVRAVLMEGE